MVRLHIIPSSSVVSAPPQSARYKGNVEASFHLSPHFTPVSVRVNAEDLPKGTLTLDDLEELLLTRLPHRTELME